MSNYTPSSKTGGKYVVKNVPKGDFVAYINQTGERPMKKSVRITNADVTVPFTVTNSGNGTIDEPYYEVDLYIKKADGSPVTGKISFNGIVFNITDGKAVISNIEKDTYHSIITYNGINYFMDVVIDGKPKDIILPNDTQTKIITFKDQNGTLLPDIREVVLYNEDPEEEFTKIYSIGVSSSAESKVNNIPNGIYKVAVLFPEYGYYKEEAANITITDSLTYNIQLDLTGYTKYLPKSFTITLDGTAVTEGRVVLANEKCHIASEEDSFSFDSISGDDYSLSYIENTGQCYTYDTKVSTATSTSSIALTGGSTHTVTVKDTAGNLINNSLVLIKKDGFEYLAISQNGVATFRNLESGDYTISVVQEEEVYNEYYNVNLDSMSITKGTDSNKEVTLPKTYHYLIVEAAGNYAKYPSIDIVKDGVVVESLKGIRDGTIDCGLWEAGTYTVNMKSFDETVTSSSTFDLNTDLTVTITLDR